MMSMEKIISAARTLFIIIVVVLISRAAFSLVERRSRNVEPEIIHDTTTLTIVVHDTIEVVKWKERVRVDTLLLAVVKESFTTDTDTTISNKENVADSALVAIPISQVTCEGENYTAVIEGFRPRLVSIDIFQQTQYIETTKTIPPKKWSFGLTLGASAGVFYTPKGIQPGAGLGATIGVTYHF